jgi:hypothetical protein
LKQYIEENFVFEEKLWQQVIDAKIGKKHSTREISDIFLENESKILEVVPGCEMDGKKQNIKDPIQRMIEDTPG